MEGFWILHQVNERTVIDPKICHGKPVIRGTRMPVALVARSLAERMSFEEVQREYDLNIGDNQQIRPRLQKALHPVSAVPSHKVLRRSSGSR
jgi:uncharacterized protein (DUF433 family)